MFCRPVTTLSTFQISLGCSNWKAFLSERLLLKRLKRLGFHFTFVRLEHQLLCHLPFSPNFHLFLSLLNHFGGKSPSLEISTIIVSEEVQQLCTMSLALRGRETIWAWQSSWRGRPHCPGQGQAGRPSETQQSGLLQIAQSADWNGAFIGQLASK